MQKKERRKKTGSRQSADTNYAKNMVTQMLLSKVKPKYVCQSSKESSNRDYLLKTPAGRISRRNRRFLRRRIPVMPEKVLKNKTENGSIYLNDRSKEDHSPTSFEESSSVADKQFQHTGKMD